MSIKSRFGWLFLYGGNWITLTGVVLVTTATILWLFLLPTLLRGSTANLYLGILSFAALPALFFTGLILMPIGAYEPRYVMQRVHMNPDESVAAYASLIDPGHTAARAPVMAG